jgi:hypothetical protein
MAACTVAATVQVRLPLPSRVIRVFYDTCSSACLDNDVRKTWVCDMHAVRRKDPWCVWGGRGHTRAAVISDMSLVQAPQLHFMQSRVTAASLGEILCCHGVCDAHRHHPAPALVHLLCNVGSPDKWLV